MVDLQDYASIAGLAIILGFLLQVLMGWPGKRKIAMEWIPYYLMAIGMLLAVAIGGVMGTIHSPADILANMIGGLFSAMTAIGGYMATKIGRGGKDSGGS